MSHAWIEGNHSSSPCIFCTKEELAHTHTLRSRCLFSLSPR